MTSPQGALRITAKAGWLFFSNLVFITAFGILFNWTVMLAFGASIWKHSCQTGAVAPHASGPGAIIALIFIVLACFKPIGLTLLFVLLFPFLYFLAGKSRGIKKALAFLIQGHQDWLLERLRPLYSQIIAKVRQENFPKDGKAAGKSIAAFLSRPMDFMENTPAWLRWVFRFLLARTQAARWVQEVQGLRDTQASVESLSMQLETRMREKIAGATQVDSKELLLLFLVNALAAALTYWFVR